MACVAVQRNKKAFFIYVYGCRVSVVSIVIGLLTGPSGVRMTLRVSFSQYDQFIYEDHAASCTMGTGLISWGEGGK